MGELLEPEGESASGASLGDGSAAAAVSLAVERARGRRGGKAGDSVADRFLARQEELVAKQLHHLDEQFRHLRVRAFSDRLKVTVQVLTILVGLLVLGSVALMAWEATRADGLVIKAFSVPPAMAARGITGEALAAETMDRLNGISDAAVSAETQRSVSGDWGHDISIQIPETGVSLSQVDEWLRGRLGHQRRVTAELMQGEDGRLTLVARSGAYALPVQTGAVADLPAMLQKTAEALYAHEQPGSYDSYLENRGRWDDALTFANEMTASRSHPEQALGYTAVGRVLNHKGDSAGAKAAYERAAAIDPTVTPDTLRNLAVTENQLGHVEAARSLRQRYVTLLRDRRAYPTLSAEARHQHILEIENGQASAEGDFQAAIRVDQEALRSDLLGFGAQGTAVFATVTDYLFAHDPARARALFAGISPQTQPARIASTQVTIARQSEDWPEAIAAWDRMVARPDFARGVQAPANHARILARAGRIAEAEAELAKTPLDCAFCVLQRGVTAALAGRPAEADHWFAETRRIAPHYIDAPNEWGRALLARGQPALAIAQFRSASELAPKWADPKAYWGEALLAQGDVKGAVGKFEEAAKTAPQWGRLHLKWGEALARQGKAQEAKFQVKAAAGLDLTPSERAELAAQKV
jgi:tetratricopeptide (TPR) repeat protein